MHPRLAFLATVACPLLLAAATLAEDHDQASRLFDEKIAPLLARHCLECHDAATKKGDLDLSRREAFLAGGESGAAVAPGGAAESLLWQYVEADLMPQDRPALSDDQKRLLREWIDAGASWSSDTIDPAAYTVERRAGENWVRRLTVPEYIETVRAAVGVDILLRPAAGTGALPQQRLEVVAAIGLPLGGHLGEILCLAARDGGGV